MFVLLIVVVVRQNLLAISNSLADDTLPKTNYHNLDLSQLDQIIVAQLIHNDQMSAERNKLIDIRNTSDYRLAFFKPAFTQQEKEILIDLIRRTVEICSMKRLTCMIINSTLLGSYRHHDLIPWEDGAELFVDKRHRTKLHQQLVNHTNSMYGLYTGEEGWKLYNLNNSTPVADKPWKWPYLDISFYRMNESHVWDEQYKSFTIPKLWLLPPHTRQLGTLFVPGPRNSFQVLTMLYGKGECQTQSWSHKSAQKPNMHPISISCDNFKEYFCFVRRDPAVMGIRETLLQKDHVLHSYLVDEPPYTLTEMYSLTLKKQHHQIEDEDINHIL